MCSLFYKIKTFSFTHNILYHSNVAFISRLNNPNNCRDCVTFTVSPEVARSRIKHLISPKFRNSIPISSKCCEERSRAIFAIVERFYVEVDRWSMVHGHVAENTGPPLWFFFSSTSPHDDDNALHRVLLQTVLANARVASASPINLGLAAAHEVRMTTHP